MITIDDLPAWLPSWEVLLTLFLSMALIGQVVVVVLSFITIALARDDLGHLQQPLIAVVSFIVIVTILATTYFIGTREDSAIQPEKRDRIVITLTPEQAAALFSDIEDQLKPNLNGVNTQQSGAVTPDHRLRYDIDGNLIE